MELSRSLIFAALGGHVAALDKATGAEVWRTRLKRTDFVSLASDGRFLYAGAGGMVFCLDPATGAIVWKNEMKRLGLGVVSLVGGAGDTGTVEAAAARRQRARHSAATM